MSTKALFGDDDDDDDDDDDEEMPRKEGSQVKETAPANEKPSEAEKEQEEEKNDDTKPASDDKTKKKTGIFADSDEDDEDDAEFDDKGAVVGLPSKTIAGTKLQDTTPTTSRLESVRSDDEEDGDGETTKMEVDRSPPAKRRPTVDKRSLVFPQVKKPGKNTSLYITKLPNLIGIKTGAFDPKKYYPEIEEEDYGPSAVHNLIRWRYKRDSTGNLLRDENEALQRESNTRLVEWADGSWTLHVGTETFEVEPNDNSTADGFAGLNGYTYLSQPATISVDGDTNGEGQPAGTVLECFGKISSRMTARPSSLQSEAHKSLTVAVRQRTIKKARIAEIATAEDPEKLKQERIRLKSDLEKASAAKRKSGGGGGGGGGRRARMSRRYLEEDEDDDVYDTINIGAEKRRMREDDFDDYGDDDDDDEDLEADETFNARRPTKRGRKEVEEEEVKADEEGEDEDEDDEEEDAPMVKSKKPARRAVLDDDDESE